MRTSIATVSLSGTLEEKLAAAAAAGFDGVEIFENDLVTSPWSPAELRRRTEDLGLAVELYQPFRDFEAVPPELFARNLRRAERKFDVMEQLGAPMLLVCSSVHPAAVDDDGLAAAQLHALAARAGRRGLRIAYEALAWGRHVSTYPHSWEIVRAADHPALGVCLDSFHILSHGSDPAGIGDVPAEKLFFLQLADAPRLAMDVLQWSRHHRCFPGQGGFDLAGFVAEVLAAGYTGPLSLEVFNDVLRQSDPARTAVDAMRSLRVLGGALPNVVEPSGYSFTELAVDAVSGPAMAEVLAAMGFAHAGQHRSKPVQLWEQGDARLLLNFGDRRLSGLLHGDSLVTALGVETADPAGAARRAESLLAPVLPRLRGPAEADLSAVAAPDGTSVFFCRTDGPTSWVDDFVPVAVPGPALVTGIDHVALPQPFDHFDEAGLFYRAVLALEPQESLEVPAPYGLVRSRPVAGGVRVVLNVSLLGTGGSTPSGPEPHHVAFATDDIVAAARAMRAAGAPLLRITDNYYEDLSARTQLSDETLAQMRELGVLYDADAGGEFFHFYTELIGSRAFFEVVQRAGGYAGYGAANAPVRMAAQRPRGT
ncbi:MAG TPA: TIM barrel protein [Mycobacteriales bacterium]|nr:TIM barrel protein [Mycobacteriales bacterium]